MQPCFYQMYKFVPNINLCRCICSTNVQNNLSRQSKFLNKMVNGKKKKKVFYHNSDITSQMPSIKDEKFMTHTKTRRIDILNKLFMKHITDLMATGEVAPQLIGRGIDISRVSVSNDFKLLNVYWYSTNDNSINESTENVLKSCGWQLQHELSQLRVIGVVPPIKFVKDKRLSLLNEIDKKLSSIDFGPDFVPSHRIIKSTKPVLFTNFSSEIKSKLSEFNTTNHTEEENTFEVNLPEMRHDIFGLNCFNIMNKVKTSLQKPQMITSNQSAFTSVNQFPEKCSVETFLSNTKRRELFDNFLKQNQIKNRKKMKDPDKNTEYLEELDHIIDDESLEEDQDFIIEDTNLEDWKE